jgi:hypothetical protein
MDCDEESTVQGQADPPLKTLASPYLPRAERQSRFNHRRGGDICLGLVPENGELYLAASHSSEASSRCLRPNGFEDVGREELGNTIVSFRCGNGACRTPLIGRRLAS